jgi:hypothetical protein
MPPSSPACPTIDRRRGCARQQRLMRVGQQVDHHLHEVISIGRDRRQIARDRHPSAAQRRTQWRTSSATCTAAMSSGGR